MTERVHPPVHLPPPGMTRRNLLKAGALAGVGIALGVVGLHPRNETKLENTSAKTEITSKPSLNTNPEFESIITQDIEVFGGKSPIVKEELAEFVDFLNIRDKDVKLDPATYYGTMFIYKDVYNQFLKDNGEKFEEFLKRHERALNDLIKYAGGSKIKLDKLVITNVALGEYANVSEIKKTDGVYFFGDIYNPNKSGFVGPDPNNPSKKIDWGLPHELGHRVLKLPDEYPLDCNYADNLIHTPETEQAFEGIPEQWRDYWASRRKDISNDLMSNTFDFVLHVNKTDNFFINQYTYYQLLRRIQNNTVHAKETTDEAAWAYPNEIPEKSRIRLKGDLAGSKVEIYRTAEINRTSEFERQKELVKILELTVSTNYPVSITLEKDQLFPSKDKRFVTAEESVTFIKITDKNNKTYLRWMDIRDFNIPYWLGYKKDVEMYLEMAATSDQPDNFSWKITYGNIDN